MFPLNIEAQLGHIWLNVFYVVIGFGFGFALERAGFGNSRVLAAQFYLRDMRVLKVMFTAIVTSMLLVFWGSKLGFVDYRALFINPTHLWPGILGGLIFGAGFVIGGYCPGTAIVSMATLKLDGAFFIGGLAVGMFIFGETVDSFRTFWDSSGALGEVTLMDWLGLDTGVVVLLVVVMALGMFWAAEKVEAYFASKTRQDP